MMPKEIGKKNDKNKDGKDVLIRDIENPAHVDHKKLKKVDLEKLEEDLTE